MKSKTICPIQTVLFCFPILLKYGILYNLRKKDLSAVRQNQIQNQYVQQDNTLINSAKNSIKLNQWSTFEILFEPLLDFHQIYQHRNQCQSSHIFIIRFSFRMYQYREQ